VSGSNGSTATVLIKINKGFENMSSMIKIQATNDYIDGPDGYEFNAENATTSDLESILKEMIWEDKIAQVELHKTDGSNQYLLLTYETGTYTLSYGDGEKEYWTFDGEKSTVDYEEAISCLEKYIENENWKDGIKWLFFQDQSKGGCLGLIIIGAIITYLLN